MVGSLIAQNTTREDIRRLRPIEPWNAGWRDLDKDGMEGWLSVYARTFFARTSGEPIAIVGVIVLFPGVAEAWACIDGKAKPHMFSLVRELKKLKELAFESLALWRLHAPIAARFEAGQRFAEIFGLEPEGRLASWFGPGEDAIMYREVRS